MRRETAEALNRLNERFYERSADAFRATRARPWPGWKRVLDAWRERLPESRGEPARVLDAGCGHGRFARFLAGELDRAFVYVGVDASARLLEAARAALQGVAEGRVELRRADLLGSGPEAWLEDQETFDLIVVLGLLHHVPGRDSRRRLLDRLAGRLAPGGLLAVSFWRFGYFERFRRRVIPWPRHNATAAEAIDAEDLEPGDLLLAWGDRAATPAAAWPVDGPRRYCHFATDEEAAALVEATGLSRVETFLADGEGGELNRYWLLARPA